MASRKVTASRKFLAKLKVVNPELYGKVIEQAQWLVNSDQQNKKPKEIKKNLKFKLANDPEFDPRLGDDTYAIKAGIDAISPDKQVANGAKRLYGSALDSVFKDSYKEGVNMDSLVDTIMSKIKGKPEFSGLTAKKAKEQFLNSKEKYNIPGEDDDDENADDIYFKSFRESIKRLVQEIMLEKNNKK
jgi:hypothetical protein